MRTQWNWMIVLVAVAAVAGCGGKKKGASGGNSTDKQEPARVSPVVANIQKRLLLSAPEKQRFAALEQLVKGWPQTRGALPAALGLLRADKENRGLLAMSLARLGRPLVAPLNALTAKSPLHLPTLRAAGALAYHLVARSGLSKRTDAEFAALRKALAPTVKRITAAMLADTRPEYEIYQGVAVGAGESIRQFKLPIVKGGLTRVAMVLYLILTNKPNEALLPATDRAGLRKRALHLAQPFAVALPNTRGDGRGESPDSLLIGLSVLGLPAAQALAAVPAMSEQAGCMFAIKAAHNLLDQFTATEAMPLRAVLQKCTKHKWTNHPNVPPALKQVLAKLDGKEPKAMPTPGMGPAPRPAPDPGHGHGHGDGHQH